MSLEVDAAALADPRIELSLLGALIAVPDLIEKLPNGFSGGHFAVEHHRLVFDALVESGVSSDAGTWLRQNLRGSVPRELIDSALAAMTIPEPDSVRNLARLVTDNHQRRQLFRALEVARAEALGGYSVAPVEKVKAQLLAAIDALSDPEDANGGLVFYGAAVDEMLADADAAARHGNLVGIPTGMPSVDEALGGLEPGTMTILAARPGMGKTALALAWQRSIARRIRDASEPGIVLNFSIEMRAKSLARRGVSADAAVPAADLKRGRHYGHAHSIVEAQKRTHDLPLAFYDAGTQTISKMRSIARGARRTYGRVSAVFIDHLHIVDSETEDRRADETARLTRISRAARALGKELECPVIALCQLNREVERRENKRPTMADLKQSGALEADADFVLFLYREEYYLRMEGPPNVDKSRTESAKSQDLAAYNDKMDRARGAAELIVAKARDGEAGLTINLRFNAEFASFTDPRGRE